MTFTPVTVNQLYLESLIEISNHIWDYFSLRCDVFGHAPSIHQRSVYSSSSAPDNSPLLYINGHRMSIYGSGPICHKYSQGLRLPSSLMRFCTQVLAATRKSTLKNRHL